MKLRNTLIAACLMGGAAHAQHGVADDRVSLPEGPGSLEGIGDNAAINANMGAMSYAVPIAVGQSFEGITPDIDLTYSSSNPAGLLGMGWDLSVPYIERMTNWGLPQYDASDRFVADGGEQLVAVGDGYYRARFEAGFVRYRWHGINDGSAGYWTAERPDGTTLYFGADQNGSPVDTARAEAPGGTFRYHLVAAVDKYGHVAQYSWDFIGGLPHLDGIAYTFVDGTPTHRIAFGYGAREDVISDARSGINEVRSQRLETIDIFTNGTRNWRYSLDYEPYADSGGLTRLTRVSRVGLDDEPHPIAFGFEYSKTLGDVCEVNCEQPYLVDMGSLGVSLSSGDATLVDINGDGLADVVDTSQPGNHRFFINEFGGPGQHAFSAAIESANGRRDGHQLSSPHVQVLDVDGNGRADLVNVRTGQILFNQGEGDWTAASALDTDALPDFAEDFAVDAEELTHVRFLDYDNDRRIDVIRSRLDETTIWRNLGANGFEIVNDVMAIGAGFDDSRLEFADMNGDGLQDPVIIAPGSLRYRINLGFGQWSAERIIENLPFNAAELDLVELEDINGDSLDDLVLVAGAELRYALNRNGDRFAAPETVRTAGGQALPERLDTTTVLFADLNGSGSDDVVWITAAGEVTYLELFPVRPNLLTRITNGLGMITEVTYVTAAEQQAEAEQPWAHTLPFAMIMVESIDTYDLLNNVHRVDTYTYADGYYDTEEKALRGFGRVQVLSEGDVHQDGLLSERTFDLGIEDRYFAGKPIRTEDYGLVDGEAVLLRSVENTFEDCAVAEADAADAAYPVRHVCQTRVTEDRFEGLDPADAATIVTEYGYDGYGQQTVQRDLGVVAIGGAGCADADRTEGVFGVPSGANCEGDERFIWREFADADGWILNLPSVELEGANADRSGASQTQFYYDGEPFAGLPAGRATRGDLTRSRVKVDETEWLEISRNRFDSHGNVIESIQPTGAVGQPGHREFLTFDAEGLNVIEADLENLDAEGQPYRLRLQTAYDDIWRSPVMNTDRFMVRGDAVIGQRVEKTLTYDALGRVATMSLGDAQPGRPTYEYSYEYGPELSRIIERQRSNPDVASPDRTLVRCLDGFERVYQTRADAGGDWVVSGYSVFNRRGETVATHRAFTANSGDCDRAAPGVPADTDRLDALGRVVEQVRADGTRVTTQHAPLSIIRNDGRDNDADDAAADTPVITQVNGLGQIIRIEATNGQGNASDIYEYGYDVQGSLTELVDAAGNVHTQTNDGAGRIIAIEDADRGVTTYTYDARGNELTRTDAEGRTRQRAYDALGRTVAEWDPADREKTLREATYDTCAGGSGFCAGRLVGSTHPLGTTSYDYDVNGNVIRSIRTIDQASFAFELTYNTFGDLLSASRPDGSRQTWQYDDVGRVVSIDGVATIEWDEKMEVGQITYANGVVETRAHDDLQRQTRLTVRNGQGTFVDLTFERDAEGNLIGTRDGALEDGVASHAARYVYDAQNRMVSAVLDGGRAGLEDTLTYAYDAAHNMTNKTSSLAANSTGHLGAMVYGEGAGPHAVTQAGGMALQYDAAGHLVQRGDMTIGWDYAGRVDQVQASGKTTRHAYDFGGDRVLSDDGTHFELDIEPGFTIEDGMALIQTRFGAQEVMVRETADLAAQVLSDHTEDGAIDTGDAVISAAMAAGMQPAADRDSGVDKLLASAARRVMLEGQDRVVYKTHNPRLDLIASTDIDGNVIERVAYTPFGGMRSAATQSKRQYSSCRVDENGLIHMGIRYYDSVTGTFISPDPTFEKADLEEALTLADQVLSPYRYASNAPAFKLDRSGRQNGFMSFFRKKKQAKPIDLGQIVEQNDNPLFNEQDASVNRVAKNVQKINGIDINASGPQAQASSVAYVKSAVNQVGYFLSDPDAFNQMKAAKARVKALQNKPLNNINVQIRKPKRNPVAKKAIKVSVVNDDKLARQMAADKRKRKNAKRIQKGLRKAKPVNIMNKKSKRKFGRL